MAAKDKKPQDQANKSNTASKQNSDKQPVASAVDSPGDIKTEPLQPQQLNETTDRQDTKSDQTQSSSPKSGGQQMNTSSQPKSDLSDRSKQQEQGNETAGDQKTSDQAPQASPKQADSASYKETIPNQSPSISSQDMSPKSQKTDSIPQQQQTDSDPPDDQVPSVSTSSARSKYPIVLTILIILAIAGISFAGYQFYLNRFASDNQDDSSQQEQAEQQEQEPPEPEISLSNGNVVSTTADGEQTVIINKSDFDTTGITGFSAMQKSPNGEWLCLQTVPPAPTSAIYVSDLSGQNVLEVGSSRKDCSWVDDQTIVYEGVATDLGPINIYKYDVEAGEETVLTTPSPEEEVRMYNIEAVSEDGSTVECTFTTETNEVPTACTIDIESGEVTISENEAA